MGLVFGLGGGASRLKPDPALPPPLRPGPRIGIWVA